MGPAPLELKVTLSEGTKRPSDGNSPLPAFTTGKASRVRPLSAIVIPASTIYKHQASARLADRRAAPLGHRHDTVVVGCVSIGVQTVNVGGGVSIQLDDRFPRREDDYQPLLGKGPCRWTNSFEMSVVSDSDHWKRTASSSSPARDSAAERQAWRPGCGWR